MRVKFHDTERIVYTHCRGNGGTVAVIDWTEDDAHQEQKKSVVSASAQKVSWLQRFLFHTGREDAMQYDHGIEVVLPGRRNKSLILWSWCVRQNG